MVALPERSTQRSCAYLCYPVSRVVITTDPNFLIPHSTPV